MTDLANDDFPVDVESARTVASTLRASSESSAQLVDDHESDHGEVLPTLLLDSVAIWYRSALTAGEHVDDALAAALALDQLYARDDEGLQTVIATGFLEALPAPDEADRWVVDRLPVRLRDELLRMEAWRPES